MLKHCPSPRRKASLRRFFSSGLLLCLSLTLLLPPVLGVSGAAYEASAAFPVAVEADGKTVTLYSRGDTVKQLLADAKITLGEWDEVYPSLDTLISGEGDIRVYRVEKRSEYSISVQEAGVTSRETDAIPYGETRVVTAGQDCKTLSHYTVFTRDDGVTRYSLENEVVLVEPQMEIREIGTGNSVVTSDGQRLAYSKVLDVKSYAYTTEGRRHPERAHTYTGTVPKVGTVAVDPRVIPLGSKLYIVGADGSWCYGLATAEDTGGSIKGNKIDLFMTTVEACRQHGVRNAKVYILS